MRNYILFLAIACVLVSFDAGILAQRRVFYGINPKNDSVFSYHYLHIIDKKLVVDEMAMESYGGPIFDMQEKGDSAIIIRFFPRVQEVMTLENGEMVWKEEITQSAMSFYKHKDKKYIWEVYLDDDVDAKKMLYYSAIDSVDLLKYNFPVESVDDREW